jgi:predicted ATPase
VTQTDTSLLDVPAPRDARRPVIRTPDQRLRVFVSSTLGELADERAAVRRAVTRLRLAPVMFEAGARPHPPRELYRAYLDQSHVFVGIYWQRYGWVAPEETISGLEDEYRLSGDRPKLMYVKAPAPDREPQLAELLTQVKDDDRVSYRAFATAEELEDLVADDLALLLTEVFEVSRAPEPEAQPDPIRVEPTALPVAPTPLVGRDDDVVRVRALLDRDDVRVVTVSGPGGIGKSRVALEVAERERADGRTVVWAGLSDVADPTLAPVAVLQSLGIREQPMRGVEETIAAAIGERELLVVLDGGERLLGATAALTTLLRLCRNVRVLVTSRAVLDLRAEHEYPLAPLDVPAEGATLAALERTGAGRLFLDVARATVPHWEPSERDAAALAEVCRSLDGVPLAIELAAARIRIFSPTALRDRLTNRLAVLTGGARDLPQRHQTLRATLDWDHELLTADEQAVFRRLGVCAGGFTLELAESLAQGLAGDPLDVVASLVAKSLVRHDAHAGEPRFSLLGVVREYALDHLAASGEEAATREWHAAFLVRFLASADPYGPEQVRWVDALEAERRNVLEALHHTKDDETALRLAAGLAPLWEMHGHLAEGAFWLGDALVRTQSEVSRERSQALTGAAHLARARLDFDAARTLLAESLRIDEEMGDLCRRARCLKDLGIVAGESNDHETAREYFRQAIVSFRSIGDEVGEAQSLNNLALSTESSGDVQGSLPMYAEALGVLRNLGDSLSVARLLTNVGGALAQLGATDLARDAMLRALARYARLGSRWDLTDSLEHVGPVTGDMALAARLLGAAEALREQLGAPAAPYLEEARAANVAAVREALGDKADAEWQAGRALSADDAVAAALAVADLALLDLDDPSVDAALERRIADEVR